MKQYLLFDGFVELSVCYWVGDGIRQREDFGSEDSEFGDVWEYFCCEDEFDEVLAELL